MLAPILIVAMLIFYFPGAAFAVNFIGTVTPPPEYRPGEVLLRLQNRDKVLRVRLPDGVSVEGAIDQFNREASIERVEGNAVYHATAIEPPDPRYADAWHLRKINAPEAWEEEAGEEVVVVALQFVSLPPPLSLNYQRSFVLPGPFYDELLFQLFLPHKLLDPQVALVFARYAQRLILFVFQLVR